ncbi:MAG: GTPase ObgE, partial [Spirochaetes bacterium]|nr:GTPase ObgE [Spirochaetota bacterium]
MPKFTDSMRIIVEAGNGGPGAVSFYREKFVPNGGPDGGDGGKGGNVIIKANPSYINLSHLFSDRVYKADNGKQGMGRNKSGKNSDDLYIMVPIGTEITDFETGEKLYDLTGEGDTYKAAEGGIGGKGNAFFKTSTHQAPRFSQPGMPGEKRTLVLDLKLIADIGIVGLPNAGKSTLLSKLTNAKPKIADYPFTTLIPNLGVVRRDDGTYFKIADIPGIIEGAHRGHGLGLSFLKHIERVKAILFLIDINENDPAYIISLLRSELNHYNEELVKKPYYILFSKADLILEKDIKKKIDILKEKDIL